MKIFKLIENSTFSKYVLRIEKGEQFTQTILKWAKENNIKFAQLNAIGAFINTKYGLYKDRTYLQLEEKRLSELTNLLGNISVHDGELMMHAHFNMNYLENNKNITIGGHLFDAEVAVTAEVFITCYPNVTIERKNDPACGVGVLDLDLSL